MLTAKGSSRIFYPAKSRHLRHNSQEDYGKEDKLGLSPLNISHDSTCDSSSGYADSATKVQIISWYSFVSLIKN